MRVSLIYLPDDIKSDEFKCGDCVRNITRFTQKRTSDLYGKSLCNTCETLLIRAGYWTPERLKEHAEKRFASTQF